LIGDPRNEALADQYSARSGNCANDSDGCKQIDVKQIDVIAGLCGIPARSEKDASNAG
jgi:hypothetical protein